ncbi:hypothetical protein FF011L_33310 [Roseimaritima multifibrata]|uniref:DUF1641 domain-containing protein n=1 Tax=Roseimaritima multifibrata TaxID=1930274 RepID=A0A517MI47_9BACT|nr:DUF1641 domain-containing protein [Roseimaritima multifibrata]QDS94552.1 hypothetical protein FF011L_33310 [Roseimaritima multifibrata]
METTSQRPPLADRLSDPATVEVLHRLLDHAESFDRMLLVAKDLPNLVAIAVDFFDAISRKASEEGIDIEERATALVRILGQITQPENMRAMEGLVSRLPRMEEGSAMLDELPNLFATAVDVFDEWAGKLKAEGIELEQSVRQGLHAALYLGSQVRKEELDRIGFLLKSDILDEHSVQTVGMAGSALSSCRRDTCEHGPAKRVGLFGLLGAIRDPNTQRALSFGLQFAKCFGGVLDDKQSPSSSKPSSSQNG